MTYVLKEILDMFHVPVEITYRLFVDGEDVFTGMALYEDKKLIPLDGENYSLEDEFVLFQWRMCDEINRVTLTVWDQIDS